MITLPLLAARQAKLMAARLRDQVALMTKGVEDSVKDANENVEAGMDSTYLGQGLWSISGGYYAKDVVVHSTVGQKYITERASVERFKAYEAPPVTIKTDLKDTTLETLQADAIQQLMANVQKEISDLMEDIFGHRDEKGELKEGEVETIREYAQNPIFEEYEAFEDQWVETMDEEGRIDHVQVRVPVLQKRIIGHTDGEELWKQEIGAGFFGKYLGAAPVTKTTNANLEAGYSGIFEEASLSSGKPKGELGRLMAEYIYWSMKEGQGYALAAAPMYDKPIWDSRGDFFQAPSIRDIADIGVTIAATAITAPMGGIGGALISAGINLADDALFATLDVAGSYKSLGEAGLEFGKKAACALVSVGAQGLFGGFAGKMVGGEEVTTGIFGTSKGIFSSVKTDTLSGVIGKTIATGLQTVTTSVATSAINAFNIQYDAYGNALGLGWSNDAFNAGVQGGLISAATSMTSTFTSGALGTLNLYGRNSGSLNSLLYNTRGIGELNNLIGGLAGQAMNYALTGDIGLNLLNLSMFGIPGADGKTPLSMGLFELHLGKNGISGKLGSGGTDISIGTAISALSGMNDAFAVMRAKTAALFGDMTAISTIDSSNMMSYNGGRDLDLARSIKNGKIKVQYGKIDGGGMYDVNTGVVTITEELLGGDRQTSAMLAAMLSHEGTHATGDRVEANAHTNANSTYEQICANYNIQKDTIFSAMMGAGIADQGNQVENTGNIDWWKLMFKNGRVKLEWDKTNTITLPDGTKINEPVTYFV